MKTLAEFREFYNKTLFPELDKLEQIRKQQLQRRYFFFAAIVISIFMSIITMMPVMVFAFLLLFLMIYFISYGFKRNREDFKKAYKETIIKKNDRFS